MKRAILLASASLAASVGLCGTAKAQSASPYSCAQLIANAEARRQIPHGLLMAIALTESGLNNRPDSFAMNIAGRGYHARDYREMSQIISNNWQKGVTSIDVGCMQINLKYHGDKFAKLTDLLDPATNVEYGASYLIQLAASRGSWREGVMDYHNKNNPSRRNWYGCKVWNNYLRVNQAQTGYVPCASAPNGSSVASNARGVSTSPILIAGYNAGAQQPTQASYGQIPVGNPLDANLASSAAPAAVPSQEPFDVLQPRQRVMGTIVLASAVDKLGEITTSADPRSAAFRSVHPVDWASRTQEQAEAVEPPATSRNQGGFARSGPAQ